MATGRPPGRPRSVKGSGSSGGGNTANKKAPKAPETLGKDGQDMWAKVWDAIKAYSSVDADYYTVLELCEVFEEKETYRRAIDLGIVPRYYEMPNKSLVVHPFVKELKDSRARMMSLFSALGLSPADRARIGALHEDSGNGAIETLLAARAERMRGRAE